MSTFSTFNQFDSRFKDTGSFSANRSACPIFALMTAYNFMRNGNVSQDQHEGNLMTAIANYQSGTLPKYMGFNELMVFFKASYKTSDVQGTTPELVKEFGYGAFLKPVEYKSNYCTIVLKNSNFFVIMVTQQNTGKLYSVRDCHEKEQYNFKTEDELKEHLRKIYKFEEMIVIDGVAIEEFGNIEGVLIDKVFDVSIINPSKSLKYDKPKEDKPKTTEKKEDKPKTTEKKEDKAKTNEKEDKPKTAEMSVEDILALQLLMEEEEMQKLQQMNNHEFALSEDHGFCC